MSTVCGILALNCESQLAFKLALDSRVLAMVLVSRVQALASASALGVLALASSLTFEDRRSYYWPRERDVSLVLIVCDVVCLRNKSMLRQKVLWQIVTVTQLLLFTVRLQ